MKSKFLKAVLPVVLLGSPALSANSVRSGARWKVKKVVTQSGGTSIIANESHTVFENPFGGFGEENISHNAKSNKQANVLSFLSTEGLLQGVIEAQSIVSGSVRKDFLDSTQCVLGATYNGKGLISVLSTTFTRFHSYVYTTPTNSNVYITTYVFTYTYLDIIYSPTIRLASVNQATFDNAKKACETSVIPTQVPTLSQTMQYLLMLLLALVGTKSQWLGRLKKKVS